MTTMMHGPWRSPGVESDDLYPGLSVNDGRVSGSIVIDHGRLPLWSITYSAIVRGWDDVEAGWSPTESYGFTANDLATFLNDLLEMRGEFGRLLLVLADAERREHQSKGYRPWWERKRDRKRVADQLRQCLAVLEDKA